MLELLVRTTAMHEYEERMNDMICFQQLLIDAVKGYDIFYTEVKCFKKRTAKISIFQPGRICRDAARNVSRSCIFNRAQLLTIPRDERS